MKIFKTAAEFKEALNTNTPLRALFMGGPRHRPSKTEENAWVFTGEIEAASLPLTRRLLKAHGANVSLGKLEGDIFVTCKIQLHATSWTILEEQLEYYKRILRIQGFSDSLEKLKGKPHPKLGVVVPPLPPEPRFKGHIYSDIAPRNILKDLTPAPTKKASSVLNFPAKK